jgi:hypothetical protein
MFFIWMLRVESILGPLGTAATTGLLYLPRVILTMEKLVEWTLLARDTEVLGENLSLRQFVHHKSHFPEPGVNPGSRGGKPATNRFSYGATCSVKLPCRLTLCVSPLSLFLNGSLTSF